MTDWWDPTFGDPELFGAPDLPGTVTLSDAPTATVSLSDSPVGTVALSDGPHEASHG